MPLPPPESEPPPEPEPPPPPPEAPKGSVEARSLHPQVDLADWTLANGLRVVFKRLDTDGFAVRSESVGPGVAGLPTLEAAVAHARDLARLGAATVVLVGPAEAEVVEGWAGTRLATVRGSRAGTDANPGRATEIAWDDLPAALVLREVLDRRQPRSATLTLLPSPRSARLVLAVSSVEAVAAALRSPSDAEVRQARAAVEDPGPALWAEVLLFLYAEPGDFRPARRPEAAADALARLRAVPPSAVNDLLDRLRSSTSR